MSLTIEQVLGLLAEAPVRIRASTAGLARSCLHVRPANDAWSVNDVLAHLRACADVWGRAIMTTLAEDWPTIRAVNPSTYVDETGYRDLDFRDSLRAYTDQRRELLGVFRSLPEGGWYRSATITGCGPPTPRTVLQHAQRLAGHERQHVRQITMIVAG